MTHVAGDGSAPADDALDRVANDVAERRDIDWSALGKHAQNPEEIRRLECLRIIGAIADLHRSGDESTTIDPARALDSSHAPPPDAGEPWGRYRLLESVGSGTFGSVYRAWDPELEREVAIKILHRHVADTELTRRLLQEGRALAQVRHPNVVSVYGVESHEDRVGLCMEFVRGETLETTMGGGHRLNSGEAALVGQDVCRALAAVHHAGFVHRDVTARNIMRDLTGRIVLMDFGTGRQTATATSGQLNIAGTPMYMAPEVLAGQPPSPCSDVYSAGVLLYYLVTGNYPVVGRSLDDLRAAHMQGRRTPLSERAPDLPIPFIQAVDHALAANPQLRSPSAGVLLQELSTVDREKRTTSSYAIQAVKAIAAAAVGVIALGAINSRYFNHVLGRADFANESVVNWLSFGVSATIAPAVIFTFGLLALGLLAVSTRLLLNVSTTAQAAKATVVRTARRLRLDDVSTLASYALLLSALALVVTWWYFVPFLDQLGAIATLDISSAPDGSLAFLSPQFREYHWLYRKAFTGVVIGSLWLWYPAMWLSSRKHEPINRLIVAGGVGVLVLSALLLDFPYRLIVGHKRDFEAVKWSSDSCYILGERQSHLLLFCPETSTPRNRIVRSDDPNLQRLGITEDIFTNVARLK